MACEEDGVSAAQETLIQAYPGLLGVLRGEHGNELRRELISLIGHAYPDRSTRKVVRVIAKMLRKVAELEVEESVLVHDISETGMSVTISDHANVTLAEAVMPVFILRVLTTNCGAHTDREVRLTGRLVRIVTSIDGGVVAAFRFEHVEPAQRQGLYDVVQWVNPKHTRAIGAMTG